MMNHTPDFHEMMDLMLEGVQVLDHNWRYVYVNEAAAQQSHYPREKLMGATMTDLYPGVEKSHLFQVMQRCMTLRTEEKFENEFEFPDGSKGQFSLRIFPVPEGIVILSVDNTGFYRAEEKYSKTYRLYKFISAINQSIVHINDEKTLLDNACRVAVDIGLFRMAWVTGMDAEGWVDILAAYSIGSLSDNARKQPRENIAEARLRTSPTGQALTTGEPAISNDVLNDPTMAGWREQLQQSGIRSMAALPLKKLGVVIGSMGFLSATVNFFDAEELTLLTEAAGDIAFAMQNYERIHQHRLMEAKLIESENRFRSLIEKSSDVKMLATAEGQHLYASPAVTTVLGYKWEELQLLNVFDLIHPEDEPEFRSKRQQILQTPGGHFSFQHRRRHRNGKWIWCEGILTNMLHEAAVKALVSNFVDVSEKKKAEQQLEFDRTNNYALINNTTDLMWSVDRNYHLITANEPFQTRLTRVGAKRIQSGESIFQASQSEEQTMRFKTAYQKAFDGHSFVQLDYGNQPADYWLEVSYCPIFQDGQVVGAACHSRDITERKKGEAKLQQTLKDVLDYKYALDVSSIVAITDQRGRITYANDNFCAISKFEREELLGQDHRILNSGTHPREFFRTLWATIGKGEVWQGEIRNRAKDGSLYWVDTTIIPFLDAGQKPYQYIAIRHDITERKNAAEALLNNNEELQTTNAELDRFVYSVSHDLRSPLSSVLGLLHFIESESHEPYTLKYAGMIRESISRLDAFIRNILNYSRNNRLEPLIQPVDVPQLITEVLSHLAAPNTHQINFDVLVEAKYPLRTDRQRLSIVLENLIGNAIKFCDPTKPQRYLHIKGQCDAHELVLTVEDNGIGIAKEYHEKVFNMFFRLDSKEAGSGLGLYIVQDTIKKLGGTIQITSREAVGTTFLIRLKNDLPT